MFVKSAVTAFLAVAFLAHSASAALCKTAQYPWAGQRPTSSISTTTTRFKSVSAAFALTGNIQVLNGCQFQMINIAVETALESLKFQWLGVTSSSDTVAMTVSDQQFYVDSSSGSAQFTYGPIFNLTTVAGREMSYYDFKILRLFSWTENNSFATCDISANGNYTEPAIGESPISAAPTAAATGTYAPACNGCQSSGSTSSSVAKATTSAAAAASSAAAAASGSASASASGSASTASSTSKSSGAGDSAVVGSKFMTPMVLAAFVGTLALLFL